LSSGWGPAWRDNGRGGTGILGFMLTGPFPSPPPPPPAPLLLFPVAFVRLKALLVAGEAGGTVAGLVPRLMAGGGGAGGLLAVRRGRGLGEAIGRAGSGGGGTAAHGSWVARRGAANPGLLP
jgi:hypothetical protein